MLMDRKYLELLHERRMHVGGIGSLRLGCCTLLWCIRFLEGNTSSKYQNKLCGMVITYVDRSKAVLVAGIADGIKKSVAASLNG